MVAETRCDAVMIGRAAATNPWIFAQMAQFAATGCYDLPSDAARHRLLSGYYREIKAANQPDSIGKMKQFACWFTHGVGNGSELRRQVHAAKTPGEVLDSVERFFAGRAAAQDGLEQFESAGIVDPDPVGVTRIEDPVHGPSQHARVETESRT
jgi:tRNA-dihydrouridine synthase